MQPRQSAIPQAPIVIRIRLLIATAAGVPRLPAASCAVDLAGDRRAGGHLTPGSRRASSPTSSPRSSSSASARRGSRTIPRRARCAPAPARRSPPRRGTPSTSWPEGLSAATLLVLARLVPGNDEGPDAASRAETRETRLRVIAYLILGGLALFYPIVALAAVNAAFGIRPPRRPARVDGRVAFSCSGR